jgi:hypothetical protein
VIFTMEVGRFCWNPVRDYLKSQQFRGVDVKWIESSGWIERTFTINGPANIARDLKRWADEMTASDAKEDQT